MSLVKYRINELAADFKMQSKEMIEIIGKYTARPKTAQKVLEDAELDFVFEHLTQAHQVESFEELFAAAEEERQNREQKKKESAATPAEPPPKQEQAAVIEAPQKKPESAEAPKEQQSKPAATQPSVHQPHPAQPQQTMQQHKPQPQQQPAKKPQRETRYVDTRGGVKVDMARYDERIDELVADKVNDTTQKGKEKIKSKPGTKPMLGQKHRQEELEKLRKLQREVAAKRAQLKVSIPDEISVGELAQRLKKTSAEVIKVLIRNGIMASVSQIIDFDTASLVAMEFNAKIEHEVHLTIEERLIDDSKDTEEQLKHRDPVVVVMGHVDHGKTSLLDAIRKTNVVSGEAGGITQHIGAYRVKLKNNSITFLDTPGHAAFTSMRMRGAQITDIAILVVAADDGIMPQTIEAINHAKAAEIPIIVAINKMDKPTANPDRISQQLTEYGLVSEEWGGDTIISKVSAVKGDGIDHLLEMVLLVAEMRELRANPDRAAMGTVIEAKLDHGRGPVATLLIQNGTLKTGDIIIAGKTVGRIRAMEDDKGRKITEAGPSIPVEVIGLSEVPGAGDRFNAVADERMARELVEERKQNERSVVNAPAAQKMSLDDLFARIQEGSVKDLNIIVKGDVMGSVEAVRASLEKLSNPEVRVRIIHGGAGAINDSDVMLANASNAIIVGFNVRPDPSAKDNAEREGVDIRIYRVIYECIEEIESAMKGMLTPKYREVMLGHAEVRQVFKVSDVGTIAGCMVQDGKIVRSAKVRIVRDGVIIHEGDLASLKRFKDDVKEVASGYECGIGIERYNDIKEGDRIEAYIMEEIKQ